MYSGIDLAKRNDVTGSKNQLISRELVHDRRATGQRSRGEDEVEEEGRQSSRAGTSCSQEIRGKGGSDKTKGGKDEEEEMNSKARPTIQLSPA